MVDRESESVLWVATYNGDLSRVRNLVLRSNPPLDLNWVNPETTSTAFFCACIRGHTDIVNFLLGVKSERVSDAASGSGGSRGGIGSNGGEGGGGGGMVVDVMKSNRHGATPFLAACEAGHLEIVKKLMDDSRIDVNRGNVRGETPFLLACYHGDRQLVQAMVDDPRVDLNAPTTLQATPLWVAAQEGHLNIVGTLLASGRHIDTEVKTVDGLNTWSEMTAKQWATFLGHPEISRLLEDFQENPRKTREELWTRLGLRPSLSADLFAMVVLLCDGHIRLGPRAAKRQQRFFKIAESLPMDLQMVLCNRVFRCAGAVVSTANIDISLKKSVRKFVLEESITSQGSITGKLCVIL